MIENQNNPSSTSINNRQCYSLLLYLNDKKIQSSLAYEYFKHLQKTDSPLLYNCSAFDIITLTHTIPLRDLLFVVHSRALEPAFIKNIAKELQPFQNAYYLTHVKNFTEDMLNTLLIDHIRPEDFPHYYTPDQAKDHCALIFNELEEFRNRGEIAFSLLTFFANHKQLFLLEPHHITKLLELTNLYRTQLYQNEIENHKKIASLEAECAFNALCYLNNLKEKKYQNKPFVGAHNFPVFQTLLTVIPQDRLPLFYDDTMSQDFNQSAHFDKEPACYPK